MIKYEKSANFKEIIAVEKNVVAFYSQFESEIQSALTTYIDEFKKVSFESEILRTMLLNNFANASLQIDNNLLNIQSLSSILGILENQDKITEADVETYNKLETKVSKDLEILQNFLLQTLSSFENLTINGSKESVTLLKQCQEILLRKLPTIEELTSGNSNLAAKKEKVIKKTISPKDFKKDIDASTSDLLCFFPKKPSDNLVISTSRDNFKLSFKNNVANISIKEEDFNLSLKTAGVQISSSSANTILFVAYIDTYYTVITNTQIKMSPYVNVSKIEKNEDFLEVDIASDHLNLNIENNMIYFEDFSTAASPAPEMLKEDAPVIEPAIVEEIIPEVPSEEKKEIEEKIKEETNPEPVLKNSEEKKEEKIEPPSSKSKKKNTFFTVEDEPTSTLPSSEIPTDDDIKAIESVIDGTIKEDEIKDNDTLIISDSNKNVVLPYKVKDLEKKLKENKKYKTLKDVIAKEYTIPLETFKNPSRARFREAFQLIQKKEHGSLKEAIELGFELMFQSDLNPAIIAACKDLDELDIYLDCLDDNELDKFSCFKIQYEVPPTSTKIKGKK